MCFFSDDPQKLQTYLGYGLEFPDGIEIKDVALRRMLEGECPRCDSLLEVIFLPEVFDKLAAAGMHSIIARNRGFISGCSLPEYESEYGDWPEPSDERFGICPTCGTAWKWDVKGIYAVMGSCIEHLLSKQPYKAVAL